MTQTRTVYLDHAASSPVAPEVLEAMTPWWTDRLANASSRHAAGRSAAGAIDQARQHVADLLQTAPDCVTFTSGGSESCNAAIKGLMRPRLRRGEPVHVVTSQIEHPAVLDSARRLELEGADVTLVRARKDGRVDPSDVEAALREDTALVSIMLVNNELGTINDLDAIGALCRDRGILVHTDASQGAGHIPIDLSSLPVDALSMSAHKMCGPQGVGTLVLQGRANGRPVEPIIEGGGHERGIRSGTLNVAGIVGLGEAARLCAMDRDARAQRIVSLRDTLESRLLDTIDGAHVHGCDAPRAPHITNIALPIDGVESPVEHLDAAGIACSSGAACSSARTGASHVLNAIGVGPAVAGVSVRFSLGLTTSADDIEAAVGALG